MAPDAPIPAFVNPEARGAEAAIAVLGRHGGFAVQHVPPAAVAQHVRDAVQSGARRILVAGGDGTIGAAASAMCGAECELAVLPAGTLNHLAQDLGLPQDLDEAVRIAGSGSTTAIDVAEVNGRIFLNTSSVGAYVTFVRTREALEPRLGYWIASGIAALRILARLRSFRVTLEVDGTPREYVTPLVFIGVGERELRLPHLGKRVPDGRSGLHVMVVRSRNGARMLALALAAVARGVRAVSHTPAMDSFVVQHVRIEPRRSLLAWRVSVDGEVVELVPPLEYRLRAAALRIVVG